MEVKRKNKEQIMEKNKKLNLDKVAGGSEVPRWVQTIREVQKEMDKIKNRNE